jgi:glycosyltransferase involved in cell wall biosynthesis
MNHPDLTFIIAHYNEPDFLELCLESIRQWTPLPYRILVGDNDSLPEQAAAARRLLSAEDRLLSFPRPFHHHTILQALYEEATTRYIVVLDQDCLLLSEAWFKLFDDLQPPYRLLVGARDQCTIRSSPRMVHVSFVILDKERIKRRIAGPLFFGELPGYKKYRIGQVEPYHTLSCKALQYHPDAIVYLEPQTVNEYGFGTYWCRENKVIAYHQWYSGRVEALGSQDSIDGYSVEALKNAKERFIEDYRHKKMVFPVGIV